MQEAWRQDTSFFKPSVPDVILATVVLLLSSASIVLVARAGASAPSGPLTAVVYRDDTVVERLDLSVDRILELHEDGVVIEVRDDRVRILKSDCPQQVCVRTGWIGSPRRVIACVPNKILVTIESAEKPFLDVIAG